MHTPLTRRSALIAAGFALPALVPAARAAAGKNAHEHHPIHRALKELKEAKHHLEHAPHDFGGHKHQAIKDVDAALHSLHKALEYEMKKGA